MPPPVCLPRTFADLLQIASLQDKFNLPYGFLFQGQAYEGLVTVACEFFWGSGGRIFDEAGNLVLDSPENRQALQFLVDLIYVHKVSPLAVTTFLEEDCRHAFEQGSAVAMHNWPYAYVIMNEPGSRVAGKFALLPPPHGPGGRSHLCLGRRRPGDQCLFRHPRAAWQLLQFLLSRKISRSAPWPWACCRRSNPCITIRTCSPFLSWRSCARSSGRLGPARIPRYTALSVISCAFI